MHHVETHRKAGIINQRNLFAMLGAVGGAIALGCVLTIASAQSQAKTGGAAARTDASAVAGDAGGGRNAEGDGVADREGCRIGTYDSRAVAVAYVRSAAFGQKMKDLQSQRAEAVKADDKKRVGELEAQGEALQVRLHLQGFSTAPIDDVLDVVRDKLPEVAQQAKVTAIARPADYHDETVEIVDVTDELVQLFNPDAQTLKMIAELRKQQPVAIEAAAKLPAK